jgi:hypothetical protein
VDRADIGEPAGREHMPHELQDGEEGEPQG